MNGNKPDYTPFELNPHHEQVTLKNVSTYAGTFDDSDSASKFDTADGAEPLISIKLFPNDYAVSINQNYTRTNLSFNYSVGCHGEVSS